MFNLTNAFKKLAKLVALFVLFLTLSACSKPIAVTADTFCKIYEPVTTSRKDKLTPRTSELIAKNLASHAELCKV